MKIGVISDIHSNIYALDAVLNEFDKVIIDKIICCGDIIGIGPHPEDVVQKLIQRKDMLIAVQGNHEKYLLNGLPENVHDDKRSMEPEEKKNHKWIHKNLSENSIKFINNLQISNTIQIENKKIYIIHYPLTKSGAYKKHIKEPTIKQNEKMFEGIDSNIFIYGHTHTISINHENNKWYINPGSLGCPVKSDIANAGILNINEEIVTYNQLHIEYDVSKTIQDIETLKFPFYKQILRIFYGK